MGNVSDHVNSQQITKNIQFQIIHNWCSWSCTVVIRLFCFLFSFLRPFKWRREKRTWIASTQMYSWLVEEKGMKGKQYSIIIDAGKKRTKKRQKQKQNQCEKYVWNLNEWNYNRIQMWVLMLLCMIHDHNTKARCTDSNSQRWCILSYWSDYLLFFFGISEKRNNNYLLL